MKLEPPSTPPTCVTIDDIHGERPGPCHDDTAPTPTCDSKTETSSQDYFDDIFAQVIAQL